MKKNHGFTLIEVLIAVTIIGILSTITIISYKNYVNTTNKAATKQELIQLAQVFEIGLLEEKFSHSETELSYESLKTSYESITGLTIPFDESQISYNNNVLTLEKRDITATYDFKTKKIEPK